MKDGNIKELQTEARPAAETPAEPSEPQSTAPPRCSADWGLTQAERSRLPQRQQGGFHLKGPTITVISGVSATTFPRADPQLVYQ